MKVKLIFFSRLSLSKKVKKNQTHYYKDLTSDLLQLFVY